MSAKTEALRDSLRAAAERKRANAAIARQRDAVGRARSARHDAAEAAFLEAIDAIQRLRATGRLERYRRALGVALEGER